MSYLDSRLRGNALTPKTHTRPSYRVAPFRLAPRVRNAQALAASRPQPQLSA
jgi:hypothetical protein